MTLLKDPKNLLILLLIALMLSFLYIIARHNYSGGNTATGLLPIRSHGQHLPYTTLQIITYFSLL